MTHIPCITVDEKLARKIAEKSWGNGVIFLRNLGRVQYLFLARLI